MMCESFTTMQSTQEYSLFFKHPIRMFWSAEPTMIIAINCLLLLFFTVLLCWFSLCKLQRKLPVINSNDPDSSFPIIVSVMCYAPDFILVNVHYITNFRLTYFRSLPVTKKQTDNINQIGMDEDRKNMDIEKEMK